MISDENYKFIDKGTGLIATAPYNFISLPKDICAPKGWAGIDVDQYKNAEALHDIYVQYLREQGEHSGYIEVDITTKTSTLVGGYGEKSGESSFFTIQNKQPLIPGSSIRGMIRNLFKIVTASSFREDEDFTEKSLYYRSLAAPKYARELQSTYMGEMRLDNRITKAKTRDLRKRGFLVRTRDVNGVQWRMYLCAPSTNKDGKVAKSANQDQNYKGEVKWEKNGNIVSTKVTINCINGEDENKDKNNVYTFIWKKGAEYIVPNHVIEAYRLDEKRNGLDVLTDCAITGSEAKDYSGITNADLMAPCFFTLDGGQVAHFGAPLYYRIPYRSSIGSHIPKTLKTKKVDYTDLVFGLKEYWGGRLSFGDATLSKDFFEKGNCLDEQEVSVALLGPNPTSFQLYLDQGEKGNRLHWDNTEADIRGIKYYWHRPETTNESDSEKITTKCKNRVKPGVTFTGKVYFKSLTTEELGALCKVLFMGTGNHGEEFGTRNEGRQFKIGKGKSIGWGSVEIRSKLFLERENSYSERAMWSEEGIVPMYNEISLEGDSQSVDALIDVFDEYAKQAMGASNHKTLEKAIKELYYMMDPEVLKTDCVKKTTMMTLPEANNKTGNKQQDRNNRNNAQKDRRLIDRTALYPVEKFIDVSLDGQFRKKNE